MPKSIRPRLTTRGLALALGLGLSLGLAACKQKPAPVRKPPAAAQPRPSTLEPESGAEPKPSVAPKSPPPQQRERVIEQAARRAADAGATSNLGLAAGEITDIGPAGAVAATPEGVVFVTKAGDVLLARRRGGKKGIEPVNRGAGDFASLARPPAVAGGFVYFERENQIVRRKLGGGDLEVLARDAQRRSRVSAVEISPGDVAVAYLTTPDKEGTSRAMLLYRGKTLTITPEGAGASSVSLVRHKGAPLAVSIDGRSGMTPVHARGLSLDVASPELVPDTVVWVGASAQSLTEIVAASDGSSAWAFLPLEKDSSHFGLVQLVLKNDGKGDAEVEWLLFENGIDLAPVAAAVFCRKLYVAFVRPSTAEPEAPQELVVVEAGGAESWVLAEARGFAAVTLSAVDRGAIVAYVADRRTFAGELSCR